MDRFNIIIAIFDTARRDRFGCYGYSRPTTPAVDALARESLVFEQMITPAPWTVPSHGSLFTGLYPREHRAHFPVPLLRKDCVTLAQHLAGCGYTTACVTANPLLSRSGLDRGFQIFLSRKDVDRKALQRRVRLVLGLRDAGAAALVRSTDRLLQTSLRPPFFLLLNFMECHWPYFPPRRFERRFVRQRWPWLRSAWRRLRDRGGLPAWEAVAAASGERLALLRDLYDAALATADDRFGLLPEALRRHGHAENTILIATADHGENIGDYGLATHQGSLHRTLIHVPFIARIPGRRPARLPGLVQFTDVYAGLCRVVGVEPPPVLQDRPFAVDPFAMNGDDGGRAYAFAEWHHWGQEKLRELQRRSPHYDLSRIPQGLEAVQDRRFKLVVRLDTAEEALYDLSVDPDETRDVASAHPAHAQRLRGALSQWRVDARAADGVDYTPDEVAGVESRLRDLGYL